MTPKRKGYICSYRETGLEAHGFPTLPKISITQHDQEVAESYRSLQKQRRPQQQQSTLGIRGFMDCDSCTLQKIMLAWKD